jgi:cyclopropane fatty-acyl-phospholipid synthase-like methyltransferase
MKAFYDLWYRFGTPPWVGNARSELVEMVKSGDLLPGRAIDLGCGEGDNAIFLAEYGFQVTAVDFAPSAIAKARAKASDAGVEVDFVIDDITTLATVSGTFDILVDYGTFDDLSTRQRAAYVDRVASLANLGRSCCCGALSGNSSYGSE